MYAIGEKYMISGLKSLAKEKFETAIKEDLTESMFYSIVHFVYFTTHSSERSLLGVMVNFSYQKIAALRSKEWFQRVIEELPSFSPDLLRKMIMETNSVPRSFLVWIISCIILQTISAPSPQSNPLS